MSDLIERLGRSQDNGVHDLRGLAAVLDGRELRDKAELLAEVGEALAFPDYYGANWDALEECLNDMSWREGPVLLAIAHADAVPQAELDTLVDIFALAAESWRGQGRACGLILL